MDKKLRSKIKKFIDKREQELTFQFINDLEDKYNIILSVEYKEFLNEYGGGFLEDDFLYKPIERSPMTSEDGYALVDYFYGEEIEKKIEMYYERFGNRIIPIASAPGGNLICIGIGEEFRGKIFYWYHENEEEDDVNDLRSTLFLVAESFHDFVMSFEYHKWE